MVADRGIEGAEFGAIVAMLERIAVAHRRPAPAPDRSVRFFGKIRIQFGRTAPKRRRNKNFLPPSLHCIMG